MSADRFYIFVPDSYREGGKTPEKVNDDSDPQYGFWVGGDQVEQRDGDDYARAKHRYQLPMTSSHGIFKSRRNKLPPCKKCGNTTRDQRMGICGKCAFPDGVRKAETFPFLVYADQRRDVCKFAREESLEAQNVALKPRGDGYVGVFFDKNENPYLFAMSASKGIQFRKAPDDWSAHVMHQDLLDREARVSLKLSQRETHDALNSFVERLSKAFPKKPAAEPKVKQAKPMPNAGKKMAGSTGKTRYNYSAQGKEKGQGAKKPVTPMRGVRGTPTAPNKPGSPSQPSPMTQVDNPMPFVDPGKLATLLRTTTEVLRKVAARFVHDKERGGREGFVKFFEKKFPKFVQKHRVTPQYLRLLFQALTQPTQEKLP